MPPEEITPPRVDGVVTADEVRATAAGIAEWQLPNGMIPWFPGGHADAWNHTEAAMALARTGFVAEAERAYEWLRSTQRPDGAWHQYYLADSIEQDKLDANTCAYVAAGVLHHWLLTRDRGFLETMWEVVEPAIDFVLDLQTPRGEITWARHADGTPWSFALLTGSSSICHSLRCAVTLAEELGHERPDWELSAAQLAHVIEHEPDAFAPKHRWAMDWYYPVLAGVLTGERGREHLAARYDTFVMPERGIRCVSDRPWVTVAETCECTLAHLAVGETEKALEMFSWTRPQRTDDGRYWTGVVYPQQDTFPTGERSTYTAAAVVLAADALDGTAPTAGLFTDGASVAPLVDFDPASRDLDAEVRDPR
ncbi:prenyltransferase/squalene oxidase repeat-containing protein [Actinomarinicola tropica]|uniref:Prenyltransferase n=1 Tax=Actinomarinicola tropica TaxID=2789776 RepID=A0A5Q2RHQ7_9ACTN|nr:prenyltransferase [Actinomarinicola tropica]QGG96388.1 prenyltransferase [Actinomarinicola tropica]